MKLRDKSNVIKRMICHVFISSVDIQYLLSKSIYFFIHHDKTICAGRKRCELQFIKVMLLKNIHKVILCNLLSS